MGTYLSRACTRKECNTGNNDYDDDIFMPFIDLRIHKK